MKEKIFAVTMAASLAIGGCNSGVPQDKYDKAIEALASARAERDQLKKEVEELKAQKGKSQPYETEAPAPATETAPEVPAEPQQESQEEPEPQEVVEPQEEAEAPQAAEESTEKETPSSGTKAETEDGIVEYKGYGWSKDYNENRALVVYFDYENTSSENHSFMMTYTIKAFQNGVELDRAHMVEEDNANSMKEIQPGGNISVTDSFLVPDDAPVSVIVRELIDFDRIDLITVEINPE